MKCLSSLVEGSTVLSQHHGATSEHVMRKTTIRVYLRVHFKAAPRVHEVAGRVKIVISLNACLFPLADSCTHLNASRMYSAEEPVSPRVE